jgi:hypothetical protein
LLEALDSREVAARGGDRPVRIPINEKYRDGEARPVPGPSAFRAPPPPPEAGGPRLGCAPRIARDGRVRAASRTCFKRVFSVFRRIKMLIWEGLRIKMLIWEGLPLRRSTAWASSSTERSGRATRSRCSRRERRSRSCRSLPPAPPRYKSDADLSPTPHKGDANLSHVSPQPLPPAHPIRVLPVFPNDSSVLWPY